MSKIRLLLLMAAAMSWIPLDSLSGQTHTLSDNPFSVGGISSSNKIVTELNSKVNMYTGKANIHIPLYQIHVDGLVIPVGVSYNTGGIKVTDVAGLVGLGWNLSVGGKMSRNVSGLEDFWPHAFGGGGYVFGDADDIDLLNGLIDHLKTLEGSAQYDYWSTAFCGRDTRPDICFFEIPGASGMFMFGTNSMFSGKTHTMPYQNVRVEYLDYNGKAMKITDANGYEYYFGGLRDNDGLVDDVGLDGFTLNRGYHDAYDVNTTWHLRKIMKDGRELVKYEYQYTHNYFDGWIEYYHNNKAYHFEYNDGRFVKMTKENCYEGRVEIDHPRYLKTIQTENETITFSYNRNRRDVYNMKLLDNIHICYNNGINKYIYLEYEEFENKAPKLKAIKEKINNSPVETICSFEYEESVNIPARNQTSSYDYWNYYNGAPNQDSCPSFQVYDTLKGKAYSHDGADRTPNFKYAKANSLTKIKYVSGGYRELEYEPHETSDGKIVGGLRIRSVKECDESGKITSSVRYEYKNKSTGKSSGRCFLYPEPVAVMSARKDNRVLYTARERYPFQLEDYDGSAIVYPEAQEIYANGGYKNISFYSFDDFPDIKADVTVIAHCHSADFAQKDYRVAPVTSYWWARGNVKSSEAYNAYNELESRELFQYELGDEKKELIDMVPFLTQEQQIEFHKSDKVAQYRLSTHYWISQAVNLKSHIIEKGKNNLFGKTEYEYHPYYNVPIYTVYRDGSNIVETFIKYPFDFVGITPSSPAVEAIKELQEKKLNIPLETYVKKNGKVISGQISTFKKLTGPYSGIKLWQSYELILNDPISDYTPLEINNGILTYDPRYIVSQSAESYDRHGYLTSIYVPLAGRSNSFIYDNFGNKTASIENGVYTESAESRKNQIYYTSFENDSISGIITTDMAKTGSKAMTKQHQIDLQNFKIGIYRLSYWKSMDQGVNWTKTTQNLNITDEMTNIVIGESENLGYWIDEVRIQPLNSTMVTTTYETGIGKTSQMDNNGRCQYWEYDELGRVERILNNDREVIKEFQYNIIGSVNN